MNQEKKCLVLIFLLLFSQLGFLFSFSLVPSVKAQESGVFGNPSLPDWQNVTVTEDSDFVVVDNADGFVWKFRKGTAGYNEIWQNGSLIVEDERWRLEYEFKTGDWRMRGEPQYVAWEQPEAYHVVVNRFYRDWGEPETTFNVTYDFYGGFRPKISLDANIGQADTYQVKWSVSGINKTYTEHEPSNHHVKFWNSDEEAVCFDYSDVYQELGNVTDVELEVWSGNHKLNQIFNVGSLQVGFFRLDPNFGYETIGSSFINIEDYVEGSLFTITEAGTADSITVALKWSLNQWTGKFKCAIYKHSDLSLVKATQERTIALTSTPTWYTFNFSAPKPSLTGNTEYILVGFAEEKGGFPNPDCGFARDDGDSEQGHSQPVTYNSFPDPLDPSHWNDKFSIYCTYTTAGGQEFSRQVNQTVTASDTSTRTLTSIRSKSESLSIPQQVARFFSGIRTAHQSFSLSSVAEAMKFLSVSVSQGLQIVGEAVRSLTSERTTTQSVSLSASPSRTAFLFRDALQSLGVNFEALRFGSFFRETPQSISISFMASRSSSFFRETLQPLTINFETLRTGTFFRQTLESLSISSLAKGAKFFSRAVQQSLSASADATRWFKANRFLHESINLSPLTQRWISISINVRQTVTIILSKFVSHTPYVEPPPPSSHAQPFLPLKFDISLILPSYVIQPFLPSVHVDVDLVNRADRDAEVQMYWWITDTKTGAKLSEGSLNTLIFAYAQKTVEIDVPTPTEEGDYTFHIQVKEPEGVQISGLTTRTFQVYHVVGWLLGPGLFLLAIIIAVVALAVIAWLKHEEYL